MSSRPNRIGIRLGVRASKETLLQRAQSLPPTERALVMAHLDLGMDSRELALLHRVSARQMRRRLDRLKNTLADPAFILAVEFADQLPGDLESLARDHWILGGTLRELADGRGETLHRTRQQLGVIRSLLLLSLSNRTGLSSQQARAALDQHFVAG
jgi:hypothetical protein